MIDIETLGTKPGCCVIQISAVPFNRKTGKAYPNLAFKNSIALTPQRNVGLVIYGPTYNWWKKTNYRLLQSIVNNGKDPKSVALLFSKYIKELTSKNKDILYWGNSARFDFGILETFLNTYGVQSPWDTWKERDYRTIKNLDLNYANSIKFKGTKHDSLDDCCHQITVLDGLLKKFKLNIT